MNYRIYLVPFSHMDLGWTYYAGRNIRKILEKHVQITAGYVTTLEHHKEFRFTGLGTFSNFASLDEDLLKRIRTLIKNGRLDLPGHLVNMPNLGGAEFHLTPESLIRNLVEGRRIHQEFLGRSDSSVLHIPDVTGSFGNLPQLLRQAGYDSYRFD